jgi:hypothetical protein
VLRRDVAERCEQVAEPFSYDFLAARYRFGEWFRAPGPTFS